MVANFMQRNRAKMRAIRRSSSAMGRTVSYHRRDEDGVETVITGLIATLGQQQIVNINPLGPFPSAQDVAMLSPEVTNRDYFVKASDLAALWPPQTGDVIEDPTPDDPDDSSVSIRRFELMSIPGQGPWRWLQGGEMVEARLHTKYIASYDKLWSDAFAGPDGSLLASHSADSPAGGAYSGGLGSIELQGGKAVAGDEESARYFPVGSSTPAISVDISAGMSAEDLDDLRVEIGLAARCASSGSGLRDGYYYTVRIQADACKLVIARASGGLKTIVEQANLDVELDPEAIYRLQVRYQGSNVTLALMDDAQTTTIASVAHEADQYGGNTWAGLYFNHETGVDVSLPSIDDLYAEV